MAEVVEGVRTSVSQASFHLFGVELKCHVLSDGSRIIEEGSFVELFKAMEAPDAGPPSRTDMEKLATWLKS